MSEGESISKQRAKNENKVKACLIVDPVDHEYKGTIGREQERAQLNPQNGAERLAGLSGDLQCFLFLFLFFIFTED